MGQDSAIEWTHHTFNPWRGCTKVSAGCANCYADTQAKRNPGTLGVWGPNGTRVVASESMWAGPLKWNEAARRAGERHRVFCASMADVFEDWAGPMHRSDGQKLLLTLEGKWTTAPNDNYPQPAAMQDVRRRLAVLITDTPHLDWLLLTKRPQHVNDMWQLNYWPRNVWLGTSVESQAVADERIPHLLNVPAKVRFLSMEPLLGPVDIRRFLPNTFTGFPKGPRVEWVIVGGESGHGARPMHPDWARSVRDQCQAAGVPFFFKQWGEWTSYPLEDWKKEHQLYLGERPDGSHVHVYRHGYIARRDDPREMRLLDGRTWGEYPESPATDREASK